jgi:hypothetical protein
MIICCLNNKPILTLNHMVICLLISIKGSKKERRYYVRQNTESGEMKKCPECAELVKREARICLFCGHEFYAKPNYTTISKAIKKS